MDRIHAGYTREKGVRLLFLTAWISKYCLLELCLYYQGWRCQVVCYLYPFNIVLSITVSILAQNRTLVKVHPLPSLLPCSHLRSFFRLTSIIPISQNQTFDMFIQLPLFESHPRFPPSIVGQHLLVSVMKPICPHPRQLQICMEPGQTPLTASKTS